MYEVNYFSFYNLLNSYDMIDMQAKSSFKF